jgi:hypothetical protein
VLKVYYDGSGKDNKNNRFLTLGGFAATDGYWAFFEQNWRDTLNQFPGTPGYLHMNEAFTGKRGFAGWSVNRSIDLCLQLNAILQQTPRNCFRGTRYTIDLEAYRFWKPLAKLPPASKQAALDSFQQIFDWWMQNCSNPILELIDIIYDRNESFLRHTYEYWSTPKWRSRHQQFRFIRTVTSAAQEHTAPLQAADMLAWCGNRLKSGPRNAAIDKLCEEVVFGGGAAIEAVEYDAEYMRDRFGLIKTRS